MRPADVSPVGGCHVEPWTAAQFLRHLDDAMRIYVEAMRYPNHTGMQRAVSARKHAGLEGFACRAAVTDEGALVGFGYGYTTRPGQWWHDLVRRALVREHAESWLDDAFELSELHVLPGYQGSGIGRQVLAELAGSLPHAAMLLSTPDSNTRAFRLYRETGFVDLARNYLFPGDGRPFAVLGARLPLRSTRAVGSLVRSPRSGRESAPMPIGDGDAAQAIRSGDLAALHALLTTDPNLATSRLGGSERGRTPLHVVTDWPGFFPNGPQVAQLLIDAGAEVDARGLDGTGETPLHWAASSDDADVARVLVGAGADVNAPGGSIGTVLDNAVGYGCWNVARLLIANGARVDKLWLAAALGLSHELHELLAQPANTAQELIDQAFWHACAGGQRRAAELLLQRGADPTFTPDYGDGTVLDVARTHGTQQLRLIEWLESIGVRGTNPDRSDAFGD